MGKLEEEARRLRAAADEAARREQEETSRRAQAQERRRREERAQHVASSEREAARAASRRDSLLQWLNVSWWPVSGVLGVILGSAWLTGLVMTAAAAFGTDEDGRANHDPTMEAWFYVALAVVPLAGLAFFAQRGWRRRLDFRLDGWEETVTPELFDSDAWCDVEVLVDAAQPEAVDAALALFAQGTRGAYYASEGRDERPKWTSGRGWARGALNCRVARQLRGALLRLNALHRLGAGITSVTVVPGKRYSVSRPSAD